MLEIDTTRPLKRVDHLLMLVAAVHRATPEDESHWVEWKRAVDLGDQLGQGTVARHILGMANRDPGAAGQFVGGYGYLLFGVEPGGLPGLAPMDPADLEPKIQRYLGDEGPTWHAQWVQVHDAHVLVIVVDPPRVGDPIFTLDKGFPSYSPGDIFVRRLGRTDKASPADVRRLTLRANPPDDELRLRVSLRGAHGTESRLRPITTSEASLQQWLASEETRLLEPMLADLYPTDTVGLAAQITGIGMASLYPGFLAEQMRAASMMRSLVEQPEDRTEEAYRKAVSDYLGRARELLPEEALMRYLKAGHADLRLEILNETDYPFRQVQVILHVPGEGVMAHEWEHVQRPRPPRLWGPRHLIAGGGIGQSPRLFTAPPMTIPGTRPRPIIDNGGSTTIRFPAVDVGPEDRATLSRVRITVPESLAGVPINAQWEARSIQMPGVARGELTLPVDAEVVDLIDFLGSEEAASQQD